MYNALFGVGDSLFVAECFFSVKPSDRSNAMNEARALRNSRWADRIAERQRKMNIMANEGLGPGWIVFSILFPPVGIMTLMIWMTL